MQHSWKLLGALAAVTAFGVGACSSDGSSGGTGATTGGTSAGTGGAGAGDPGGTGGDIPGAGGDVQGTGGDGTGGGDTGPVRTPHADDFDCSPPQGAVPSLTLEPFASPLHRPVFITQIPGSTDRFVALELDGEIELIENGALVDGSFLDLTGRTSREDNIYNERGLIGLAFHPDYVTNGLFYVHHTASGSVAGEIGTHPNGASANEGDTVIVEYKVTGDPSSATSADPGSARIVWSHPQPANNHNGGTIAFGSDGMLYVALGDGGGADDQYGNGQDITTPLAAILRIDVDGRAEGEYSVPPGNLRDTVPTAHPLIWSYGLRNPYRIAFDGCTGDLYIGDVGQSKHEEVNVEARAQGGKNYGWSYMEGNACRGETNPASAPEECIPDGVVPEVPLTLPVTAYPWTGGASVVGGQVYRGSAIPGLRGAYLYGDYVHGQLRMLRWNGSSAEDVTEIGSVQVNGITSIGQDSKGELLVTLMSGELYRIVAAD